MDSSDAFQGRCRPVTSSFLDPPNYSDFGSSTFTLILGISLYPPSKVLLLPFTKTKLVSVAVNQYLYLTHLASSYFLVY